MGILFFHLNGIQKTKGGVSRITDTLGRLFLERGVDVCYVGLKNLDEEAKYNANQYFLPDYNTVLSRKNIEFMSEIIKKHGVTCIINQAALSPLAVELMACVRKENPVKLVSCFHNSILTPIYHGAYQKEFKLKQKHLGILFHILRLRFVNKITTWFYILNNRKQYKRVVDTSDWVTVLCEGQRMELQKMCGNIEKQNIVIIPNCQEPSREISVNTRKEHVVLWAGTFDTSVKRPDNMLKIWERVEASHPEWQLKMLGDGPSFDDITKMAQGMSLANVKFEGRVEPSTFYKIAEIVCVTSVHESFSLVATEAHSYGLPVIAFNSFTAAPLVIENGKDGILVPPFDIEAYAEKLSDLMDNDKQRLSMSKEALKSIEKFSPETICSKWESILS